MPQQQDPRAMSIQKRLDNWGAKQLGHIPAGTRATLERNWYAQQGFLLRAAHSPYAEHIVAGGAWALLIMLLDHNYSLRITRDLDLDLPGVTNEPALRALIETIIKTPLPPELDDHLVFDSRFSIRHILPGTDAGGYRVVLTARLGPTTRILFSIDMALAFEVAPAPQVVQVPRLLQPKMTVPVLLAPVEAILAGKVASLLRNGFQTTRLKDFYDCWLACQRRDFTGDRMIEALQATCRQQGVALDPQAEVFTSVEAPLAAELEERWKAFLSGNWLEAPTFAVVVQAFRQLYRPVVEGTVTGYIWHHQRQEWRAAQESEQGGQPR